MKLTKEAIDFFNSEMLRELKEYISSICYGGVAFVDLYEAIDQYFFTHAFGESKDIRVIIENMISDGDLERRGELIFPAK